MSFSSWRGVVGMINPTMRPGMTEEVCRLLPEGIGLIPLFLNISRGTEDEFETMMPHYEKLVAVLAEQKCDIIHPNGAPPFMVHGYKGEAKIVANWEKKYQDADLKRRAEPCPGAQGAQGQKLRRRDLFPRQAQQDFRKIF